MLKQIGDWLKGLIIRPLSVTMDVGISLAVGIVAYMLIGLVKGIIPLGDAVQAAGAGIIAAGVYMRARTNLLDPSPAFKQ